MHLPSLTSDDRKRTRRRIVVGPTPPGRSTLETVPRVRRRSRYRPGAFSSVRLHRASSGVEITASLRCRGELHCRGRPSRMVSEKRSGWVGDLAPYVLPVSIYHKRPGVSLASVRIQTCSRPIERRLPGQCQYESPFENGPYSVRTRYVLGTYSVRTRYVLGTYSVRTLEPYSISRPARPGAPGLKSPKV